MADPLDHFRALRELPAVKHDDGKPDFTLVPWPYVGDNATVDLIIPLYDWWRRSARPSEVADAMRAAYARHGRDFIADINASLLYGARKYAPWNWQKGLAASRLYAAACRHYVDIEAGRRVDAESGLDHHCHLAFYAAAIFDASPDDRPDDPA